MPEKASIDDSSGRQSVSIGGTCRTRVGSKLRLTAGGFGRGFSVLAISFSLLNLPFWLFGHWTFFQRFWFNVDLLIPCVLANGSLGLAAASLFTLWFLDLAVSESVAWNFRSAYEFISSIEFAPDLQLHSYLSFEAVGIWLVFFLCGYVALRFARTVSNRLKPVLTLLFVIALADLFNGSSFLWSRAQRLIAANIAGSSAKIVASSALNAGNEPLRVLPKGRSLTSQAEVLTFAKNHPDRSILLVIVESMGLHKNTAMREELLTHLVDAKLSRRFAVNEFVVLFHGSTVAAELRELCGIEGTYRSLAHADNHCLPDHLAAMGWSTLGLHGFTHRMFNRDEWWPKIGIQSNLFAEGLSSSFQFRCGGAFVGICDADLLRRAVQETRGSKRFVYALTLNSHLPLNGPKPTAETQLVCDKAGVGSDVCALTAVLDTSLQALREALSDGPDLPLVLVVGDHAPPFASLVEREQFNQRAVPGIVLIPKV